MNRIKNLKIGTRLGAGFGIMLMFVLTISAMSIENLEHMSGLTSKLYKHPYTVSTAILRVDANIARMHRSIKDVALARTHTDIGKITKSIDALEKKVYSDLTIIDDRFLGDKEMVDRAKALLADWKPLRDEAIELMERGEHEKAIRLTKGRGVRHVAMLNGAIQEFIDFAQGKADTFLNDAESAKSHAQNTLYLAIILTVVTGGIMAFFLTIGITGPLKIAVAVADNIAGGNLNQTITSDTTDETGMLLAAMKHMSHNLADMIGKLKSGSDTLVDSSTELTDIAHEMTESAHHVASKSGTVSVASEQMSGNMNSVAAAIEEATTNVSFVASAAEEMSATISEISQNSQKARDIATKATGHASSSSARVSELGRAADEIGKVTEAIAEISDQTNLLALNATIEAARAGDAGKGFAVVASEIKVLAQQTAGATSEIREKIEGIQSSTQLTVEDISAITTVIQEINDIVITIATSVDEQAMATREIASNVSQASLGMAEITENVAQGSRASEEVAKDIVEVNSAADEMNMRSGHVNTSAEVLSDLSRTLKDLVAQFTI